MPIRRFMCLRRWKLGPSGVILEEKIEVRKRIGRSPDIGDAAVMCWFGGQGALHDQITIPTRQNLDSKPRSKCVFGPNYNP
jgi:hypothetical protein